MSMRFQAVPGSPPHDVALLRVEVERLQLALHNVKEEVRMHAASLSE